MEVINRLNIEKFNIFKLTWLIYREIGKTGSLNSNIWEKDSRFQFMEVSDKNYLVVSTFSFYPCKSKHIMQNTWENNQNRFRQIQAKH